MGDLIGTAVIWIGTLCGSAPSICQERVKQEAQ